MWGDPKGNKLYSYSQLSIEGVIKLFRLCSKFSTFNESSQRIKIF